MRLFITLVLGLLTAGCQSTPGFHFSIGYDLPPTLNATAIAHPLPTAMQTTYAVESSPQMPVIARQIGVTGPSGYSQMQVGPTRPQVIQRETIQTMPRENGPCGQP